MTRRFTLAAAKSSATISSDAKTVTAVLGNAQAKSMNAVLEYYCATPVY